MNPNMVTKTKTTLPDYWPVTRPDHGNNEVRLSSKRRLSNAADDESSRPPKRLRGTIESRMTMAREILKHRFGFDDFQSDQEQVIKALLNGQNCLVILPTNAGKSLCYQLPALCYEAFDRRYGTDQPGKHGITLVISPLISLMTDQVAALKKLKIAADAINVSKSTRQIKATLHRLAEGKLRILFCAPERFLNETFAHAISTVPGGVRLLAVDEAHCIAEWGYSFRPEYMRISQLARDIEADQVVCLTATATEQVAKDISKSFNIRSTSIFKRSIYRPNLKLEAKITKNDTEKHAIVQKFLKAHLGQTVIYVPYINMTKKVPDLVQSWLGSDVAVEGYSSDLSMSKRKQVEKRFMNGEIQILVATLAYGMGINKKNIRNIIHYSAARSLEDYSQEVGRAGRDGDTSNCLLLLDSTDIKKHKGFARRDFPKQQRIEGVLKYLFSKALINSTGVNDTFDVDHEEILKECGASEEIVQILYAVCEKNLRLFEYRSKQESHVLLFPTTPTLKSGSTAPKTLREFTEADSVESPAGQALNSVISQSSEQSIQISITDLETEFAIDANTIANKIQQCYFAGYIAKPEFEYLYRFKLLQPPPTSTDEIADLARQIVEEMNRNGPLSTGRVDRLAALFTGEECYAAALSNYFGMGLPDGLERCEKCTWCVTGTALKIDEMYS